MSTTDKEDNMSNEKEYLDPPMQETPRYQYLEHEEERRKRVEEYIYRDRPELAPHMESLLSSPGINYTSLNAVLWRLVGDRDYWNSKTYELEDRLAHEVAAHDEELRHHQKQKAELAREIDLERARKGVGPYKYSRIAIIKAMRSKLAFGLKEAKDFLDFVSERVSEEDQRQGPWDFQTFRKVWNEKVCNNNPGSILFLGDE